MKFYIETLGCQMNEHDSEKMAHLLRIAGYEHIDNAQEADIVIVNTCCVREKAEQKFYSLMGRLKRIKAMKGTILGVTGCIAQMEKESISDRLPFIDFSLGTSSIHKVQEAIEHASKKTRFLEFSENGCGNTMFAGPENVNGGIKKFITIMKGCNNFCSYCIVPYVRGREASRDSTGILKEIYELAKKGIRDVTLLGQNVNSYNIGTDGISFPELLQAINRIEGIERIRFVTSHPKDLSDKLIDCFGSIEKLCEQIHLPFQSGSDKVLKLMNRGYTVDEYKEKIRRLRNRYHDIAITGDCIVGFPGEGEKAFEETMQMIKDIEFDSIFSFAYSPRKYTSASTLPDEVPRDIAQKRLKHLQEAQKAITLKKNRTIEGSILEVLVEGLSKNSNEDLMGRTRTNKIVNFAGNEDMIGKLVHVKIVKGYANSLKGELEKAGDRKYSAI
ncbi:MAG: tRNA (N6-isopentenyl adenosine(37)-C2)-methylthiotransferase MiaB [Proteobacteria bacterium]|nr:tRNA (N6-isopentenyl adenosine(37)-C2)-methylthiotransferase MiaB [Pseudomonadota bacterium]